MEERVYRQDVDRQSLPKDAAAHGDMDGAGAACFGGLAGRSDAAERA